MTEEVGFRYAWELAALQIDWITVGRRPDLLALRHDGELLQTPTIDANRYRAMYRAYRRTVARPFPINRCVCARELGARLFGVDLVRLLGNDRDPELIEIRYKIMAFTKVVTGHADRHVAAHFQRGHSAVAAAMQKYGAQIKAIVDEC
jgi:hypothetical protein